MDGNSETYTIRIVDSNTPIGCWMFKQVWTRAMAFVDKYNTLTDKPTLSDLLSRSWIYSSTDVLVLAGYDKCEKVVAHLIAQVQCIGGHSYAMVMQVEADEGSADILAKGGLILQDWIHKKSLKGFADLALSEAAARLWTMKYKAKTVGWLQLGSATDLGGEGIVDGRAQLSPEGKEAAEEISQP